MAQHVCWGTITLLLEQERFEQVYQQGRRYYFEDDQEAFDFERTTDFSTQCILHLIAHPDAQGHYQLDDGLDISSFREGVEELLGVLVGYMSGPLMAESLQECEKRRKRIVVLPEAASSPTAFCRSATI